MRNPIAGVVRDVKPAVLAGTAVVNFEELSHHQAPPGQQQKALLLPEVEEPAEPVVPLAPGTEAPVVTQATSPAPTSSFMGLDDIPMVDSLYIVIPPDVGGAVGPNKVMSGHNNNYRIFDKSTGAVVSTVGTATFWAPSGETALNGLTDPRTLYDPYNNCWIAVMQTVTTGAGNILVGVSQTSDPNGLWFLYRFATGATIDFPNVGFNKNWIAVAINQYSRGGTFSSGITLVVNYPLARTGTGSGVIITQQKGTHFASSPCITYSATEDTLFVPTHLSSSGGTYSFDTITGTPSAPVYTASGALTRPGGGWAQPGGNILPQSAPNSGASACGATPCPIESQDSQIRSAPVYRSGFVYYAQTIGLPASGLTHTSVQWTKLSTQGGAVSGGGFVDGGQIDDPTATSTNGGKWYSYTHLAVNATGDFLIGYSQFSSAQHPSSGYSMHLAGDAAGSVRDPFIYKPGEDYYHKTFSTTTGRNRWGDFSAAQVDPTDDQTLWTLQEYGKTRPGTNDGNTGANSSRWSTYWVSVGSAPLPTVVIGAGPSLAEGNSGFTAFQFPVTLSAASGQNVTVQYQTSDGTATVANNDYQAASGSITILAGSTSGVITVNVVGDTNVEPNETFNVTLTGATNATLGTPITATATILNDDLYTILASAGPYGTITPSGTVNVVPGANQSFTIAANPCSHIVDVLVDGGSVGTVGTFTFTSVAGNHTIAASFAPDQSASVGNVIQLEGNSGTTAFDFPVSLSGPCSIPVDVVWKTSDGTATVANNDFLPDSTVMTFAPGAVTGTITVQVVGDTTPEDSEDFHVNLLGSQQAGVAQAQGTGTILNDDSVTGVDIAAIHEVSMTVRAPVGGAVSFRIALPASAQTELSIYDVAGRRVAHLVDGVLSAGYHTVPLSSGRAALGSGVYFAKFRAAGKTLTTRFVVLH
ncbi:MAG: Calx-beta domain-containing protein [Bacteroidota bacterium]